MPKPVSKKQFRYIKAILHGDKNGTSKRGDRMPASVAGKYDSDSDKGLPESKGKEHEGGTWTDKHHKKHAEKNKSKKKVKKTFLEYYKNKLSKSKKLKDMLVVESLEKNIMRGEDGRSAVYDVTHGDALRLIGNGTFRMLQQITKDMTDEEFKEVKLGEHTLNIRKHISDVYSGRISDGHKVIHQFTNRSIPALCVDLMSVFEWYSPEDEGVFDIVHEDEMSDDIISGGLQTLADNYTRHNISNIYSEMENIREDLRNGVAVDLQQVEAKMMKLFDKLENCLFECKVKHNEFTEQADAELTDLENKLLTLQRKVDQLENGGNKEVIEAVSANPANHHSIYDNHYLYLPKPRVEIGTDGKITIAFGEGWSHMEKQNFVTDMRARVVKNNDRR